ncbi:hypothetical protein M8J76_006695 [Diaphorina citri]|nr:hypothetical protein M8J76_006695 [Diaphorina citri]
MMKITRYLDLVNIPSSDHNPARIRVIQCDGILECTDLKTTLRIYSNFKITPQSGEFNKRIGDNTETRDVKTKCAKKSFDKLRIWNHTTVPFKKISPEFDLLPLENLIVTNELMAS